MASANCDNSAFRPDDRIDDIFEFCGSDFNPAVLGVEFVDDYTLIVDSADTDEIVVTG